MAMILRRLAVILGMLLAMSAILHQGNAQTARISSIAIAFSGTVTTPEEVQALIAARMKMFVPAAKEAGVTVIHLQSDAYSLAPGDKQFAVNGNLFIDVLPESKTNAFVTTLGQKSISATIQYFQYCRPR